MTHCGIADMILFSKKMIHFSISHTRRINYITFKYDFVLATGIWHFEPGFLNVVCSPAYILASVLKDEFEE